MVAPPSEIVMLPSFSALYGAKMLLHPTDVLISPSLNEMKAGDISLPGNAVPLSSVILYVLPESKAPVEHDVVEIAIMPNAITVVIFLFIYSSVFWLYLSESSAKVLRFLDFQKVITLQLQGVFPIDYM